MFTRTESFRDFIRLYPIVSIIVTIHLGLYLLTSLPIFPNNWFFENLSGVNLYIMEGEYWRLITPTFMHSGFSHTLFNSFSLVLFGPALERMLGGGRFLFIYLLSGIIANVATLSLEPLTYTCGLKWSNFWSVWLLSCDYSVPETYAFQTEFTNYPYPLCR